MTRKMLNRTTRASAADLLLLTNDPVLGRLVSPAAIGPTRRMLQAAPGLIGRICYSFKQKLAHAGNRLTGRPISTGASIHNALRKLWIEDQIYRALMSDCSQIVTLGAGFDTLAYRLHPQFPDIDWWEADHPAIYKTKRLVFNKYGEIKSNLKLAPVDFLGNETGDIFKLLPGYDGGRTTVIVIEDLLTRLPEINARELLGAICSNTCQNSWLLGAAPAPAGDPCQYGIPLTDIAAFLKQNGFKFKEFLTTGNLIQRYSPGIHLKAKLPDEFLFRARR